MLNGKLSLHELDDVEGLCVNVIRSAQLELPHHDYEDCLAYLVETAWELSLVYEQGDFPSRFGVYLSRMLKRRVIDWQRQRHGRTRWQFAHGTYERELPTIVTLDDRPDGADDKLVDHADAGGLQDLLGLQRARCGTAAGPEQEHDRAAARPAA